MSKASGALIMTVAVLVIIYAILQFLIAPRANGMENSRRHTTYVYGIPIPPISRVVSIIMLILLLALSALMFLIGKLYYGTE